VAVTFSVIPLINQAQTFAATLLGVVYNFRCYWNSQPNAGWCLDIFDQNNVAIVLGVPLTTGQDLMLQYAYLNFPGSLYVLSEGDPDLVPTYTSLGQTCFLFFGAPA
jgi:hypothetical protein